MAIASSTIVVICIIALAYYVDAAPRQRPVAGPDIYRGQNVAHDVLLPGEKINDVTRFGAKPDGKFDSTQAFMDAWQATCKSKEQSRLYVPVGRFLVSSIIFQGPCLAPNPVTFQVEGTVLATPDISDYENGDWLMFQNLNGIKVIGNGVFDGQGKDSWAFTENCEGQAETTCVRNPSSLFFSRVNNGLVQGIRSVNSKGFHIFVTNSANFRLRKLKLVAPETSPNTDGIHLSHTINVIISKNTIATGDDCISMIQGVANVSINNLKCGPGHGISIGSLGKYQDELEVRGIRVRNATLVGTTNGLRVKSWPDRYAGSASEIFFSDIRMDNVKNPIIIDQEYECDPGNCKKKPSLVKIKDVHFSNIKGTTISPVAVDLRCSALYPCEGVTLDNIELKHTSLPTTSRCVNTKPLFGGINTPSACV